MNSTNRWMAAWLIAVAATSAASAQSPSAADVAFFESKVRPLLVERCQTCHSSNSKRPHGKLWLDSRDAILKGGETGPALVPGDVEHSLLIHAIRYGKEDLQMPPSRKLPAKEIAILEEWVRRGAPFPGATIVRKEPGGIDWTKGRTFWSFQPPRLKALPNVRDKAWPAGRIDTFVLAEMEKRGLAPTIAAERRTLIRRATFDLIGLPPSPEEIDAFVKDERPDAYARLIERLLNAPEYGERWARVWLDLVRYCDVAEPWAEGKGQPWLYRDWVVKALNEDVPYDDFLIKQIAADLMPKTAPHDRAALGFLGLSPQYWKELLLDKDVIAGVVAEEWEERIGTISGAFLGLTVACARCHDHKFDPISTQDYYALAGVLASVKHADLSLLPDTEAKGVIAAQAQIQKLQEQIKKLGKSKDAAGKTSIAELQSQIDAIKKATPKVDEPMARGIIESSLYVLPDGLHRTKLEYKPGVAQDVAVQIRGNPANLGPVVPRRFLTILSPEPRSFKQGSGRLELANAIVTDGAPLSARVIVNRIWQQHFGIGIVATPSDFGVQGARPTHPELLDDLTVRFMQNRWSLKWLHREIMLSSTYQQASTHDAKKHAIDPDNRWLWRMPRRRLDVEMWRDAMLVVNGTLRIERGGKPLELSDTNNQRRTIYGTVRRREIHDMLRLFDFPDPTTHNAVRIATTTPLQQLFTLNSPFMTQQADALVRRLKTDAPTDDARIRRAYRLLFGRDATEAQVRVGVEFLGTNADDAAWRQYAQVLLGSNEFLFVD